MIALCGDLGAGKTCFVQGAAAALGVTDRVTSPTFVLVKEYAGRLPVLHLDVYRMGNLQELVDLGYEEFLDPSWVVFIEWGDAVGQLLPSEYVQVVISAPTADERRLEIEAHGPHWSRRLAALAGPLEPYEESA